MALEDEKDQIEASESSSESVLTHLTEIIVEILLRLPVDSVLRCKSVYKLWCSVISNPQFVKCHLSLSTRNNHYANHRLIFSIRRRIVLKTCHLHDALSGNSINDIKLDCPFKGARNSVWIVGSCNGLLCICVEYDTLLIWNPSTRKFNKLPYSKPLMMIDWSLHYGFGYDESTDDYKVIEMCCKSEERYKYETLVRVYSLRDGNWKDIGVFPHGMPLDYSGTCLNGALHWPANDTPFTPTRPREASNLSFKWNISSFDLATEAYWEVSQPVYDEGHSLRGLTLGTLREWLCVLCDYHENHVVFHVDLWVMKVYGVKDSWTKLVSIPYLTDPWKDRYSVPLCISSDGKFLLLGAKLIVYDSRDSSFSKVRNNYKSIQASTYVESLVSPIHVASLGNRS